MKKRIVSALLILVMVISMLPASALAAGTEVASGTCGENLTWTLDSEGTLTISGTGAMAMYSRNEPIPWYEMRDDIKMLIVEDGVTIISATAFRDCRNMEKVSLPNTVTRLGINAFYNCDSLESIVIPDSVTMIEPSAFSSCDRLKNVTLPDGITVIDQGVFQGCHSLESITIPEGVTEIMKGAFVQCIRLKEILFPSTLQIIGPETFHGCTSLTEITIPDSVTQICGLAFENSGLIQVWIPASVTDLQVGAFRSCPNLTGIWVDEDNPNYCSDNFGVLYDKNKMVLMEMPGGFTGEYVIPEGVTETNIMGCHGLTELTVPGSVKYTIFADCTNLTNLILLDGVECIGQMYNCVNLGSVTIPASVTKIDEAAFNDCEYLWHVLYTGSETQWAAIEIGEYNDRLIKATRHYDVSGDEMISLEPVEGKKCHEMELLQCGICDEIFKGRSHVLSEEWEVVSRPTCTQDGEQRQKCKYCDYYESVPYPAPGHAYKSEVTASTCLEKGFTTHTCTKCGDYYVDNWTDPTGHSYVNGTCTGCGDVQETYAQGDHDRDGDVDVDDVLTLLWHVLFPEEYPLN